MESKGSYCLLGRDHLGTGSVASQIREDWKGMIKMGTGMRGLPMALLTVCVKCAGGDYCGFS